MAAVADDGSPALRPEVIMVAHPDAELRLHGTTVRSARTDAAPLSKALTDTRATAQPLFGATEERVQALIGGSPWALPDLSVFYRVDVDADHEGVAARLLEQDAIQAAYVKPAPVI